jgi:DNA-binding SARP family transcriptional activator/pimeloyl-ACP methyl ester carboxylesterase
VEDQGSVIAVDAPKARRLLVVLLSRANQVVSLDEIQDALWPQAPPRTAAKTLQTYVSQVRQLIGHDRVSRTEMGYALRVDHGESDVVRFEELVRAGRDASRKGQPESAAREFFKALQLWRGNAFVECADHPPVSAEAARLQELRLTVDEERIEAEIASGAHREIVADLESALHAHPLRERLWLLLITALYRSERQADALNAYQRARRTLLDELGVEPGPTLRRLHAAILGHEPVLDDGLGVLSHKPVDARPAESMEPPPRPSYVMSGPGHVGYQVVGTGDVDVLLISDWYNNIEALWGHEAPREFLRNLATVGRLILFDSHGTGLSDPLDADEAPTLDRWVDDAVAVLDAVGSSAAVVVGNSVGAAVALLLADRCPERVAGLVLNNPTINVKQTRIGKIGYDEVLRLFQDKWGKGVAIPNVAGSRVNDVEFNTWFGQLMRLSLSPGQLPARIAFVFTVDVDRAVLERVRCPTVVVHRSENRLVEIEHARDICARIPGAQMLELAGEDHVWFVGDSRPLAQEVARITESRASGSVGPATTAATNDRGGRKQQ